MQIPDAGPQKTKKDWMCNQESWLILSNWITSEIEILKSCENML